METVERDREIKRQIFKLHGIEGLPDEELDKALLYQNDHGGLVIRFKAVLRTKDWRMHIGHSS